MRLPMTTPVPCAHLPQISTHLPRLSRGRCVDRSRPLPQGAKRHRPLRASRPWSCRSLVRPTRREKRSLPDVSLPDGASANLKLTKPNGIKLEMFVLDMTWSRTQDASPCCRCGQALRTWTKPRRAAAVSSCSTATATSSRRPIWRSRRVSRSSYRRS